MIHHSCFCFSSNCLVEVLCRHQTRFSLGFAVWVSWLQQGLKNKIIFNRVNKHGSPRGGGQKGSPSQQSAADFKVSEH